MITNFSRASLFLLCKKKCFNYHHRRIGGNLTFDLSMGTALHAGVARGLATKDWVGAHKVAADTFTESSKPLVEAMLDEEKYTLPAFSAVVDRMIQVYQENFSDQEIEVIQPECEFDFPIDQSEHNCIFRHWRNRDTGEEFWRPPTADEIASGMVGLAHHSPDPSCKCWGPHRVVGKTDAVVMWNTPSGRNLWLLEHKTSSREGEAFWDNFLLDLQPTTYLLGIWRTLGIRPRGFIINQIFKPSENQVKAWNSKRKYGAPKDVSDYIRYNRQAFLREDADLLRAESQYRDLCDEWEDRIVRNKWPMTNVSGICQLYNRKCAYHSLCLAHDSQDLIDSLPVRDADYVDAKYINIEIKPEKDQEVE